MWLSATLLSKGVASLPIRVKPAREAGPERRAGTAEWVWSRCPPVGGDWPWAVQSQLVRHDAAS